MGRCKLKYSDIYQYFWMRRDRPYREKLLHYRQELEQNEWLSSNQIQEAQWYHLKRLLEHAYANVPFYRRRFDEAGIQPGLIKTPEDIQRIPILTRQDVQANLDDLIATNCDRSKLRRNYTGGSTGTPMVFYQDHEHQAYHNAAKLRLRAWAGFEMGDKLAVLWGADRDISKRGWIARQRLHLIMRERRLNTYNLTPEKMEGFAQVLIRWQPKYILSYASSAYLFASFLQERGLDHIRPVAIETSAEKLWDFQRPVIEDAFKCRVFNFYGSREITSVAAECEKHAGLHVFSDIVYLELLHDGQPVAPGQVGEIIVTDLANLAMPFIRYQNGDLAQASSESCSCDRPFPLLTEIIGRSNDVLSTPNGQYVHGAFFNHLFFGIDGVQRFQVHQTSLDKVTIKIQSNGKLSVGSLQTLREKVVEHLGPGIEIKFQTVDMIPPTPTGKYRYIISEVPLAFVTQRTDLNQQVAP